MNPDPISLRRRHLLIASAIGGAAPALCTAETVGPAPGDRLVVSGRLLGADGRPLTGARVEACCSSAMTDADGRFVLAGSRDGALRYRVSHNGRMLAARDLPAQFQRDEAGVWRATFGLALA